MSGSRGAVPPWWRHRAANELDRGRLGGIPDFAVCTGPRIGEAPVLLAADEVPSVELVRRPLVEKPHPGQDQAEVEQPPEPELAAEVVADAPGQRVLSGKHSRELEEDPGHAQAWVAEDG